MSKRIMFFPSYMGGGFGHTGRSLGLAEAFEARGWQAALVAGGPHAKSMRAPGRHVYRPRFPTQPRPSSGREPAYTYIPNASFQVLRDGFTHPWRVYAAAFEALSFVRRFKPDVLVGDLSLLTWIVGQRAGLPVVQLVRSLMHPAAPHLIWWEQPPDGSIHPDPRPVFQPLLQHWGLNPVSIATDLFRGDLYLVPGIPELDPLPADIENTEYIGAVMRSGAAVGDLPPAFKQSGQPVVYVTLGGGAGPVANLRFFDTLNRAFAGASWQTVVSTGRKFRLQDLPPHPDNISYHTWLPGPAAVRRSSAVVFHGGFGTLMDVVQAGVPGVVLPFHTEQEANGRRLEQNLAGCVISPASDRSRLVLQRGRWRYGEYALWIVPEPVLQPAELRAGVESVLSTASYRHAAQDLARSAARYAGAVQAVRIIEKRV